MRLRSLLLAALLMTSFAARAESILTFDLNATLQTGSVTGTLTIDTTKGLLLGSDFTARTGPDVYVFNLLPSYQGESYPNYSAVFPDAFGREFIFSLPVSSLMGYTGGPICSLCATTGGYNFSGLEAEAYDTVISGNLSSSATPEPSSIILFSTGLLAAAAGIRSRCGPVFSV